MGNVSALCVEAESTLKALWRMWALSQALSVGRGLAGRKAQARRRAVGARRCIVLALVEVGMWSVRKRKGGRRGLVWEGCVLFTVGLQASSLRCFLLLMRVPSGLLRVSWPGPRKEMMQLAPNLPGCALIQNTKREERR